MDRTESRGFTLVELTVAIIVFGLILAFSVPAYQSITQSNQLHGAVENMAAQLRLAREKAMATGSDQTMKFYNVSNPYYLISNANGQVPAKWMLQRGISFYSMSSAALTMKKDGRANIDNTIVLRDRRGNRDTVSVMMSGLVLTR